MPETFLHLRFAFSSKELSKLWKIQSFPLPSNAAQLDSGQESSLFSNKYKKLIFLRKTG